MWIFEYIRLFHSLFLEEILSLVWRIVTVTFIVNENLREVREYGKPQNQSPKGSAPVLKYAHLVDQWRMHQRESTFLADLIVICAVTLPGSFRGKR